LFLLFENVLRMVMILITALRLIHMQIVEKTTVTEGIRRKFLRKNEYREAGVIYFVFLS